MRPRNHPRKPTTSGVEARRFAKLNLLSGAQPGARRALACPGIACSFLPRDRHQLTRHISTCPKVTLSKHIVELFGRTGKECSLCGFRNTNRYLLLKHFYAPEACERERWLREAFDDASERCLGCGWAPVAATRDQRLARRRTHTTRSAFPHCLASAAVPMSTMDQDFACPDCQGRVRSAARLAQHRASQHGCGAVRVLADPSARPLIGARAKPKPAKSEQAKPPNYWDEAKGAKPSTKWQHPKGTCDQCGGFYANLGGHIQRCHRLRPADSDSSLLFKQSQLSLTSSVACDSCSEAVPGDKMALHQEQHMSLNQSISFRLQGLTNHPRQRKIVCDDCGRVRDKLNAHVCPKDKPKSQWTINDQTFARLHNEELFTGPDCTVCGEKVEGQRGKWVSSNAHLGVHEACTRRLWLRAAVKSKLSHCPACAEELGSETKILAHLQMDEIAKISGPCALSPEFQDLMLRAEARTCSCGFQALSRAYFEAHKRSRLGCEAWRNGCFSRRHMTAVECDDCGMKMVKGFGKWFRHLCPVSGRAKRRRKERLPRLTDKGKKLRKSKKPKAVPENGKNEVVELPVAAREQSYQTEDTDELSFGGESMASEDSNADELGFGTLPDDQQNFMKTDRLAQNEKPVYADKVISDSFDQSAMDDSALSIVEDPDSSQDSLEDSSQDSLESLEDTASVAEEPIHRAPRPSLARSKASMEAEEPSDPNEAFEDHGPPSLQPAKERGPRPSLTISEAPALDEESRASVTLSDPSEVSETEGAESPEPATSPPPLPDDLVYEAHAREWLDSALACRLCSATLFQTLFERPGDVFRHLKTARCFAGQVGKALERHGVTECPACQETNFGSPAELSKHLFGVDGKVLTGAQGSSATCRASLASRLHSVLPPGDSSCDCGLACASEEVMAVHKASRLGCRAVGLGVMRRMPSVRPCRRCHRRTLQLADGPSHRCDK